MTKNTPPDKEPKKEEHPCQELEPLQLTKVSTRRYLIIGIFFLLIALFFFGYFPRMLRMQKSERLAAKDKLPQASVLIAKPQDAMQQLVLPSITQANHVTPIWARTNGYLIKLHVDIGDEVKTGQLLAELDTPEIDQEYEQAVNNYKSAFVRRNLAKINAERAERTYAEDPGAISKLDRDQFIATYMSAEADLHAFEANMAQFKDLVNFKYIVAPFDGIIIERDIDIGSLISSGSNGSPQQLFVIAATDIIRVFVSVPQTFFRSIKTGLEGITHIREFANAGFKSVVARYAKALDQTAHTMLTELHIDNKNGELVAGLYANVTLQLKPEFPYFIVPTPAVIIRAGDTKVAVLDANDIAHLKPVKIGIDYGRTLQIIEGIQPNDRIVINPTEKIRDGIQCKVVEVQQNDKYFFPQIY